MVEPFYDVNNSGGISIIIYFSPRQRLKGDTKQFYLRLLSSDINRGAADYYVVMLFLDFLCMITIILGVSSFGVSDVCSDILTTTEK